jgi:hypothetical protein
MPWTKVRSTLTRGWLGLLLSALPFTVAPATAGILDATWTPPTLNADGSELTDLASYRLYYGTSDTPCPSATSVQVASPTSNPEGNQTMSFRLAGLAIGTRYSVAVTAVDTNGNQSPCSNVASAVARADFGVAPSGTVPFGGVNLGASAERTFIVSNTVGGTVSGSATVAAPFQIVSGSPFTLAGMNATQTVTVRFTPTATTVVSTNLRFTANGGTISGIVTGNGVAVAAPSPPLPSPLPPPTSPNLAIGSRVQVVNERINVRATAGGALLGTHPVGAFGTIVGGPQRAAIGGSRNSTQYTYWRIDYEGGVDGWSGQDNLALAQPGGSPPPVPGTTFAPGSRVQVTRMINVRATAGGSLVGTQPVRTFGTIVSGPERAAISGSGSSTRYTYWRIDYETGVDGWSGQDNLTLAPR